MNKKINPPLERSKLKNVGLFLDDESDEKNDPTNVAITAISLPQSQPRRYFDSEAMGQLIESIKQNGILQPLLVRPLEQGYQLVAGERRYRAAKQLGLTEVPVYIRSLSEDQVLNFALTENLQREDLNPLEETETILDILALKLQSSRTAVISLLNQLANSQRGLTDNVIRNEELQIIEELFQGLGRFSVESFRTNRLPLLNLPSDILTALQQGQLAYTKAKAIAKIKDEEQRQAILTETINEELSLSQIKEKIALLKNPQAKEAEDSPPNRVKKITKQLSGLKIWETDQKKWKKIQGYLEKIEAILQDSVSDTPSDNNLVD